MPTRKPSAASRLSSLRKDVKARLAKIAGYDRKIELSIGQEFADKIAPRIEGPAYSESVFINCPFDDDYKPLFLAAAFAVARCGYVPRCAKEQDDSSNPRMTKILAMIAECRLGIHDLSRIEDADPRFNMPSELGLFLGAKHYGRGAQDRKACLVFERDPNTYDKFLSDFSGHDIKAHGNQPRRVVQAVRNWLAGTGRKRGLPGGAALWKEYQVFKKWIKTECSLAKRRAAELTWSEYVGLAVEWTNQSSKPKRRWQHESAGYDCSRSYPRCRSTPETREINGHAAKSPS